MSKLDIGNIKDPATVAGLSGVIIITIFIVGFFWSASVASGSVAILDGFFGAGFLAICILMGGNFFTASYRHTLNIVGAVVMIGCFAYFVYQAYSGGTATSGTTMSNGFAATGTLLLLGVFGFQAYNSK